VQTDIESALIGINHLAERLELSRRTIQRILAKGDLPSLQIGRRRLVKLSELQGATARSEHYENRLKRSMQVLTHGSRTDGSEGMENQRFRPLSNLGADLLHSIVVKGPWREETPNAPSRRKRAVLKVKRRRRRKKGDGQLAPG
jgi:excisionase family DNA binding protein